MRDQEYYGKGKLKTDLFTKEGLFRNGKFLHGKIHYNDGVIYEGSI
jgi:hypothetical protein